MPIETICQTCNNRLRVADEHAGKLARCPKCQSVYTVPTPQAAGGFGASVSAAGGSASGSDQWRLRTADGMVYGPVSRADLDRWLVEGRVTADSHLLQDGAAQWVHASQVYPQLATASRSGSTLSSAYAPAGASFGSQYGGVPSPQATAGNPFGGSSGSNPFSEASVAQNPYGSPAYGGMQGPYQSFARPHRGALVLVLGILGLTACALIGIPAAFLGMSDLREMNAGRMDPSGKGLTIAGMVMGLICCAMFALGFLLMLFVIIAGH